MKINIRLFEHTVSLRTCNQHTFILATGYSIHNVWISNTV